MADPFAFENHSYVAYVDILGTKWKVTDVELQYPRMILSTDSVKATGTSTFVQAVDTLAETNISGFVSAFRGSSSKVRNVGSILTSALASGVKSKSNTLSATASNMAESMKNSIASKDKEFQKVGVALISALAIGIQAQANQAVNAANYVGASAANGSGQAYTSFYVNGINLGMAVRRQYM